ncbi:MAG: hypothetical protein O7D91_15965 [Planctomycetota bacterium]|nr:hypothetical protein [Planctomycetota bacterium]
MSKETQKLDANQSQAAEDAVVWFSVLVRGVLVGDASMETEALSKLRQIGIDVRYTSPKPLTHSISGGPT